jgi:SAM-dependent methyltransferase
MSDEYIEQLCLDSLPPALEHGRGLLLDSRVHRWMASVNAIPGGFPVRPRHQNHQPDAARLPGVLVVGDYMFDATLNGVLDSADVAADIILANILTQRRGVRAEVAGGADIVLSSPSEDVYEHFFEAQFLSDIFKITWDVTPGARILIVGSGSGRAVASLRAAGFDAIGIELNRLALMRTPAELRAYNLAGEFTDLPFPDDDFDVVVETGLCQLPREKVERACAEMRRVTKRGVVLGSVTIDLSIDLIERYDLLAGVKTLSSRWDWSEKLYACGFDHALNDPARLAEAWKRAEAVGAGPGHWYEDAESLLFCVYEKGSQGLAAAATPDAAKAIAGQAYHVERVPTATPHVVR